MLVMGMGCVMLAVLELFAVGFQQAVSRVLFALSPAASVVALLAFMGAMGAQDGDGAVLGGGGDERPMALLPTVIICLGIVMFTVIGSSIQAYMRHLDPVPAGSGLFGVFDALALVLTGALLVLAAAFAGRRAILHSLLVMPSVLALAYALSVALPAESVVPTYTMLALSRRMTLVFWAVIAISCGGRFMVSATIALTFYRIAQTLGAMVLTRGIFDYLSSSFSLLIIGELAVTMALCPLIAFVCLRREGPLWEPSVQTGAGAAAQEGETGGASAGAEPQEEPVAPRDLRAEALQQVAGTYGLSVREAEVLELVSQGWRAASIAEKLVLSPSTVKNHMNSIYGKLGVHTQDELRFLVEEAERSLPR